MNDTGISSLDTLADEDRAECQRHIDAAHAAQRRGHLADVEFGQHLYAIKHALNLCGDAWDAFMRAEYDLSGERGDQLIFLGQLHDALVAASVEPLTIESHARAVKVLATIELQVRAVQQGRELAEAEGARLYARHLEAAVREILDEAIQDAEGTADAVRDAVRSRGGLHVVVPEGNANGTAYAPGLVLVPWTDEATWPSTSGGQGLTRAAVDEAAEFVWPVVVPDPWTTAQSWEAEAELNATLFPERLGAPASSPAPNADARSRCVVVAPGVDLLHPDMPERVAREVAAAIGEDPHRVYLVRTEHAERAQVVAWPANVVVCVGAHDAASAANAATATDAFNGVRCALVLHDVREPLPPESLRPFAWVLLRGSKTSQAAYDSVLAAAEIVHVGREVRANLKGYLALTDLPAPAEAPERSAVAVTGSRDPETGVLHPPTATHAP